MLLATLLHLLLLRAYFVILGAGTDLSYLSEILGPSQLVSFGIIALLNQMIGTFDDAFSFSFHLEAHSVIVAFCLGMIITFATAAVSAYRVSRMNIAEAVRGLPETIVLKGEEPFFRRFLLIPKALVHPLIYLWQALRDLANTRFSRFWLALGGAVLWLPLLPIWWVGLSIAVVRFLWPYLRRGLARGLARRPPGLFGSRPGGSGCAFRDWLVLNNPWNRPDATALCPTFAALLHNLRGSRAGIGPGPGIPRSGQG